MAKSSARANQCHARTIAYARRYLKTLRAKRSFPVVAVPATRARGAARALPDVIRALIG
jgi:hypothetical protein